MASASFTPRRIDLEALIKVLVEEHAMMRDGLVRAKEAASKQDFAALSRALKEVDPVFRQHIADEEAQILRLLIDRFGFKGAAEEIRVFQQHRPIYQLMKKVAELAGMPTAELQRKQDELSALFDDHTLAEEQRVFPRVLSMVRSARE